MRWRLRRTAHRLVCYRAITAAATQPDRTSSPRDIRRNRRRRHRTRTQQYTYRLSLAFRSLNLMDCIHHGPSVTWCLHGMV